MKDLGHLNYFLDIKSHFSNAILFLSQHQYVEDLLQRFDMVESKHVLTLIPSKQQLSVYDGELQAEPTVYMQEVRALQYATMTRPDISFVVNLVSQFMHQPRVPHLLAAK